MDRTVDAGWTGVVRTPTEVAELGAVLGIWAHPDDEAYLSAGLMAAAVNAGNRVGVITATRGERGTDDPHRNPPGRLAPTRVSELASCLSVIGGRPGRIRHSFLGDRTGVWYLDGMLNRGPGAGAVAELATLIEEFHPDTIVTFGPDGMTGHPDHRTVSAWVTRAVAAGGRPIRVLHSALTADWARDFGTVLAPMDDGDDAFAITDREELAVDLTLGRQALSRKITALRAHSSQTRSLRRALGSAKYRSFVASEWFRPADGMLTGADAGQAIGLAPGGSRLR